MNINKGKITEEFYETETSSIPKRMLVYTPPHYGGERLPVLYLTHGIGQTEISWIEKCGADSVFDDAILCGEAEPFIAVMVNGRASEGGAIPGEKFGLMNIRVFMDFEYELISRVIPEVDSRYNTDARREGRAIAGFSMGGYQSVNFGLEHLDKFAYIGGFSPAPAVDPKSCAESFLAANRNADIKKLLRLFYLSNGALETGGEGIFGEFSKYSLRCLEYMDSIGIECVYETFEGGHEAAVWKRSLESFIRLLRKQPRPRQVLL